MTSNIGARFIQKRGALGFQGSSDVSHGKMEEMVMNSVRQTFNPEFINRLDEIIVFDELGDEELLDVLQLQVDQINRTMSNHGFIVRLGDDAKRWILRKTCADRSYGARPLRRALQKHVEDPLSEALIQGQLADASLVEMFVDGDELSFRSIMIDEEGIEQPTDLLLTQ
jgi:ATP-dependent Clp protease ATP-binding subunit ClpC